MITNVCEIISEIVSDNLARSSVTLELDLPSQLEPKQTKFNFHEKSGKFKNFQQDLTFINIYNFFYISTSKLILLKVPLNHYVCASLPSVSLAAKITKSTLKLLQLILS